MGAWTAQNSRGRQVALSAGSVVVGTVAGFLLGVLLLGIGVAGRSSFVNTYYLVLNLTSGQEYLAT